MPGFTASILHLPDEDLTAIALLNSSGKLEATYLTRRALRILLTGAPQLVARELSAEERARLVGRYPTDHGSTWTVDADGTDLVLDLAGNRVELLALSATTLCASDSDGTWCFAFELDREGRAGAIRMSLTCEPQGRATCAE